MGQQPSSGSTNNNADLDLPSTENMPSSTSAPMEVDPTDANELPPSHLEHDRPNLLRRRSSSSTDLDGPTEEEGGDSKRRKLVDVEPQETAEACHPLALARTPPPEDDPLIDQRRRALSLISSIAEEIAEGVATPTTRAGEGTSGDGPDGVYASAVENESSPRPPSPAALPSSTQAARPEPGPPDGPRPFPTGTSLMVQGLVQTHLASSRSSRSASPQQTSTAPNLNPSTSSSPPTSNPHNSSSSTAPSQAPAQNPRRRSFFRRSSTRQAEADAQHSTEAESPTGPSSEDQASLLSALLRTATTATANSLLAPITPRNSTSSPSSSSPSTSNEGGDARNASMNARQTMVESLRQAIRERLPRAATGSGMSSGVEAGLSTRPRTSRSASEGPTPSGLASSLESGSEEAFRDYMESVLGGRSREAAGHIAPSTRSFASSSTPSSTVSSISRNEPIPASSTARPTLQTSSTVPDPSSRSSTSSIDQSTAPSVSLSPSTAVASPAIPTDAPSPNNLPIHAAPPQPSLFPAPSSLSSTTVLPPIGSFEAFLQNLQPELVVALREFNADPQQSTSSSSASPTGQEGPIPSESSPAATLSSPSQPSDAARLNFMRVYRFAPRDIATHTFPGASSSPSPSNSTAPNASPAESPTVTPSDADRSSTTPFTSLTSNPAAFPSSSVESASNSLPSSSSASTSNTPPTSSFPQTLLSVTPMILLGVRSISHEEAVRTFNLPAEHSLRPPPPTSPSTIQRGARLGGLLRRRASTGQLDSPTSPTLGPGGEREGPRGLSSVDEDGDSSMASSSASSTHTRPSLLSRSTAPTSSSPLGQAVRRAIAVLRRSAARSTDSPSDPSTSSTSDVPSSNDSSSSPTPVASAAASNPSSTTTAPPTSSFVIWIIGGLYRNEDPMLLAPELFTGGANDPDSLWALAALLGQVKPPTTTADELEAASNLVVIKGSGLSQYLDEGNKVLAGTGDRCLVCLEDYEPDASLRILSCRHLFHKECIDNWLVTGRNSCPCCRAEGVKKKSMADGEAPAAEQSGPAMATQIPAEGA